MQGAPLLDVGSHCHGMFLFQKIVEMSWSRNAARPTKSAPKDCLHGMCLHKCGQSNLTGGPGAQVDHHASQK